MELIALMNNTKWNELRLAMYQLGDKAPKWRTCCVENGYISAWDGEWFYHFQSCDYAAIEWIDIQVISHEQELAVHKEISKIHLPGEKVESGYRIYGYAPLGKAVEYV